MTNKTTFQGKNMSYDPSQPYCGFRDVKALEADFREAWMEAIEVPNHCLPESFRDHVRGGRSLKRLEELCEKRDGITPHVKQKAVKARNIERLAAQVNGTDITEPLDWSQNEVDEIAQHRAECALVNGMVNGGFIDADDLLE
jgi:hypothetical protein